MASNFSFQPMGLSGVATVGGAAPVTVSLSLQAVGATVTTALTGGNYLPAGIRLVNEGTASVFLQFGDSATGLSVSPTIGMRILQNTDRTFSIKGRPFMALACASTFTVTVGFTLGEGR